MEYGTAQPAGAEAKGTMRDDCISGRESKVFELCSEKPRPTGSRNEETQCLCEIGGAFSLDLAELNFQLDRRLLRFRVLLTESWALLRNERFALTSGTMGLEG